MSRRSVDDLLVRGWSVAVDYARAAEPFHHGSPIPACEHFTADLVTGDTVGVVCGVPGCPLVTLCTTCNAEHQRKHPPVECAECGGTHDLALLIPCPYLVVTIGVRTVMVLFDGLWYCAGCRLELDQ
jgi:hypothetical protein